MTLKALIGPPIQRAGIIFLEYSAANCFHLGQEHQLLMPGTLKCDGIKIKLSYLKIISGIINNCWSKFFGIPSNSKNMNWFTKFEFFR